jgi:hypothetical protein
MIVSPNIILYGFGIFFACLITHIVIWRIRVPKNDALILFILFLFIPSAIVICTKVFYVQIIPVSLSGMEIALVLLLNFALSAIYISSYPAAQAASPSLKILLIIESARDKRMTAEEIFKYFENQKIILTRINELVDYNLVIKDQDRFSLKPFAMKLVSLYIFYRWLLGLPVGRG